MRSCLDSMLITINKPFFSLPLKEIDDILSGVLTSEDEEAVDKEFDELIAAEGAGDNMEQEDINLPDIPTDDLPGKVAFHVLLYS